MFNLETICLRTIPQKWQPIKKFFEQNEESTHLTSLDLLHPKHSFFWHRCFMLRFLCNFLPFLYLTIISFMFKFNCTFDQFCVLDKLFVIFASYFSVAYDHFQSQLYEFNQILTEKVPKM